MSSLLLNERPASMRGRLDDHRFRFRFDGAAAVMASVQRVNMSWVALIVAAVDCRFASAAILPRAEFAMELAPLSHMLMSGFFSNQGLDNECSSMEAEPRPFAGCLERMGRFTEPPLGRG